MTDKKLKIRDQFGEEGQGKYCEKCGGMCEDIFNHDSQSGLTKEKK